MQVQSTRFGSTLFIPCDECGSPHARGTSDRYRNQRTYFCSPACQHTAERARWSGKALATRFWAKVQRTDTCWLRPAGCRGSMGYGYIVIGGRRVPAHRFAWESIAGTPIPDGFKVCHTCDIPTCVRNDGSGFYEVNGVVRPRRGHLWIGTHADNMADMRAKGRSTLGDRNGARLHRERMSRGDRHRSRTSPETLVRGEAVHCAKLTADQVREIRVRRLTGESYKSIAKDYGVTAALCCAIALRHIWKHVA